MLLIPVIVLPCFLIGWLFSVAIRRAYRAESPARPLFLYPLICSAITTGGFMLWGYYACFTSKSSTAAIGFFFIPFYAPVIAVIGLVVSWAVLYIAWFIFQRIRRIPIRFTSVTFLILAMALLAWTGYISHEKITRYRLLNEAASGSSVDRLEAILADGISSRDLEVLAKIANNPNTPINDLIRLFDHCKPNIAKSSPPEYSIFFSLAKNPQTPPDILATLASCRPFSIRYVVAGNPNTPTPTLRKLVKDLESSVKEYAISKLNARERSEKPENE